MSETNKPPGVLENKRHTNLGALLRILREIDCGERRAGDPISTPNVLMKELECSLGAANYVRMALSGAGIASGNGIKGSTLNPEAGEIAHNLLVDFYRRELRRVLMEVRELSAETKTAILKE